VAIPGIPACVSTDPIAQIITNEDASVRIAMSEEPPLVDRFDEFFFDYQRFLSEMKSKEAAHFSAIGFVASEWAALEVRIDQATLQLSRISVQVGFCLTAQIAGIARKLDAYTAIARHRVGDGFLSELRKFKNDATGLAEQRNRVVHDPWTFQLGSTKRLEITARGKLRQHVCGSANS
jgi:hypothetical protein